MSYNGHPVIDADSHIREYVNFDSRYRDHMDPEFRDRFDHLSSTMKAWQRSADDVGLGDFLWPRPPAHPLGVYDDFLLPRVATANDRAASRPGREIDSESNSDPSIRLRDMDIAGVDTSVMFSSQSDGFCMLHDVSFESALNRAYNRSTSAYCSGSKGRLHWVGNGTMRDISETISQLTYWAGQDENFAGMFISRACPDGTMLDNPSLHPLFAAAQELDLPIWVHGGSNRPPLTPWVDGPNAVYHGIGGMYAMSALIGGGIFDLFPTLRVGLFESGIGWVPWLVEKLDGGLTPGSHRAPKLKRKPSEILAEGRLFCSIEADEEYLEHAVAALGDDIWLFATDYPHTGSPWPDGLPLVTKRDGLSEAAKIKILGTNAQRFLPRLRVQAASHAG